MAPTPRPRLALTPGEPGGIGPDLAALLAGRALPGRCVLFADPELLRARAVALGRDLRLVEYDPGAPAPAAALEMRPVPLPAGAPVRAGIASPAHARYVLDCIEAAGRACLDGACDALATGPVHKSALLDAGLEFRGHTEHLARQAGAWPVMLLAAGELRVALATTHLPLAAVPAALTRARLERTLAVLCDGLRARCGLARPRVRVLGLNPHAGEGGHLGREELETIAPAVAACRARGERVEGPAPADTAFAARDGVDAFLAMYHDQGLPVLKALGFGRAVNITLGLPYPRTSVDHGTALALAGTGRADPGSWFAAIEEAAAQARRAVPRARAA